MNAAMSPSAAATGSVLARAATYGKLAFQWPHSPAGTSHMWFHANAARRAGSNAVSMKSLWNSRRGDGVTPMHHSR
jgi:hypothetical protein